LGDTLIFGEDFQLVKDWCNRQSRDGSTTIETIQLRSEYVVPFHQFIVVQIRGELGRAYRVDRSREREGWSVFDTIKKLGVPPRDTIALLQEPVGELDQTSQCSKELHCSDDKAIDLMFVLGIGFRIHNAWGTRYNLPIHNCYFFAQTIINTCDDRLGKESSRSKNALKHILGKLYRWLPLLLWASLLVSVLALRLGHISFPGEFGVVIVFVVVNMLLMPLVLMQMYVALAVRVVVAEVVQRERELGQREVLEVEWRQSSLLKLVPGMTALGMLLLMLLMMMMIQPPPYDYKTITIMVVMILYVVLVIAMSLPAEWMTLRPRVRLLNTRTEDSSVVRATAAAEPEQELGVELVATRRLACQSDEAEARLATGPTEAEGDSHNRCGAAVGAGSGIDLEQEQGIHV
jgi:hypothetical protein